MGKPKTTVNINQPSIIPQEKEKGLLGSALSGKTMKVIVSHTNMAYNSPFRYLLFGTLLTTGNIKKKNSVKAKEIK